MQQETEKILYHDKSLQINEKSVSVIKKTVFDLIKNEWISEVFQNEMKNSKNSDL